MIKPFEKFKKSKNVPPIYNFGEGCVGIYLHKTKLTTTEDKYEIKEMMDLRSPKQINPF